MADAVGTSMIWIGCGSAIAGIDGTMLIYEDGRANPNVGVGRLAPSRGVSHYYIISVLRPAPLRLAISSL
jgi:hypothetical protein